MRKFAKLVALTGLLVSVSGGAMATTFTELGLSLSGFRKGVMTLGTSLDFDGVGGFSDLLTSYLHSHTVDQALADLNTITGVSALLPSVTGVKIRNAGSWSYAFSFDGISTVTASNVGVEVATYTVGDRVITPGPVAGAGLPAALALIGFAAWRRRQAHA